MRRCGARGDTDRREGVGETGELGAGNGEWELGREWGNGELGAGNGEWGWDGSGKLVSGERGMGNGDWDGSGETGERGAT